MPPPARIAAAAVVVVVGAVVFQVLFAESNRAAMAVAATRARNAGLSYPGRHAVVVGGTSGIGQGVAMRLAQANFTVTVVGRNAERGREVVAALGKLGGTGHEFIACNGELVANAQAFGAAYKASHPSLDVLVLTQGMATLQGRTETAEGLDQKLALHYYSRMAFVTSLLPIMRGTPSPRVLTVLSAGVHAPYSRWETDPELRTGYTLRAAAEAGCMYNDLAVEALAADPANAGVTFAHAAPGVVSTRWGTEMPWWLRGPIRAIMPLLGRSIADCGEVMADVLLRPDAGGSAPSVAAAATAGGASAAPSVSGGGGRFLLLDPDGGPAKPTSLQVPAVRDAVWAHTLQVIARAAATSAASAAAAAAAVSGATAGGTPPLK